jgi:hypothetical protein
LQRLVIPIVIASVFFIATGAAFPQTGNLPAAEEAVKKYEGEPPATLAPPVAAPAFPVEVTASGKADRNSCSVGGTIRYTLSIVSKAERGKSVFFKPWEAPLAQGLDIVHQALKTKRRFHGGKEITILTRRIDYRCAIEGSYQLGPVTVAFELDEGNQAESTAVAPAVTINVKPGVLDRMRSIKSGKWIVFVAGLAAFGIAALFIKRRFRRSRSIAEATARAQTAVNAGENPWDGLAKEAGEKIDGDFHAQMEELFWTEAFSPDPIPEGAAATRISMLSQRGAPLELLNEVRKVVNACQVGRYTGSVSRGDAMATLTQARQIIKKLSVYRPEKIEEDDNGTAR